jgi:hypothetical protein
MLVAAEMLQAATSNSVTTPTPFTTLYIKKEGANAFQIASCDFQITP